MCKSSYVWSSVTPGGYYNTSTAYYLTDTEVRYQRTFYIQMLLNHLHICIQCTERLLIQLAMGKKKYKGLSRRKMLPCMTLTVYAGKTTTTT